VPVVTLTVNETCFWKGAYAKITVVLCLLCKNENSSCSQPKSSTHSFMGWDGNGTIRRWPSEYQLEVNGKSQKVN